MDDTGQGLDELAGTELAGCKIMKKLGQGGMGSVYLARHEALDKLVCVKLLSPDLAREERNIEFFLREARSAAKLEHPNIVHVYNFGQEKGKYFIVMSWVDGKPLSDIVVERGPFGIDDATNIVIRVLEGLGHAHSHTIIHRDIKPSNILLGTDGQPRIVDFGLARSINEEKQLTIAGEMVGTAYFMSPEQGLAAKVDHRADLYSTGATYFYLLTARFPFDGKSAIEVIHKHIGEPFPNILVHKPGAPLWISKFLEKITRKKPEERYQTAAEAIEDLNRMMAAEKDGTAVSNERNIEIPEISARLNLNKPAPPPPPGDQPQPAPLISDRVLPPSPPKPSAPPSQASSPGQYRSPLAPPENQKLQMPKLYNSVKAVMHFCASLGAVAAFLLAGAAGRPAPDLAAGLASPLKLGAGAAGLAMAAGLGLLVWAVVLKPRKFTGLHAIYMLSALFCAYAGAVYVQGAEGLDMVARAFLALTSALKNMTTPANSLAFSLVLFLASTRAAFASHWGAKIGAFAGYSLSVLLTYNYFRAGLDIQPDKATAMVAGTCALAGFGAIVAQRSVAVFFNPALFFLVANLLAAVMFNAPQIAALTEERIRKETSRVDAVNREKQLEYQETLRRLRNEVPEYDLEGNPIMKPPPPEPDKALPAPPAQLAREAEREFSGIFYGRLAGDVAKTSGLVLVALFLCLMANVYFIQETFFPDETDYP